MDFTAEIVSCPQHYCTTSIAQASSVTCCVLCLCSFNQQQDFEGQRLASRILKIGLWASVVVALPVGLVYGSFIASLIAMLVGTVITCLVVLPPWPMYNKHPLKYLAPKKETKKE